MPKTSLRGRRVLLTGASSGIGAAAARRFAEQGAELALVARGREGLERVAAVAGEHDVAAHVLPVDLTDRAAAAEAVDEAAARLGGLDVVVANAAALTYGPFEDTDAEAFDRCLDSVFGVAVHTIRPALPHLRRSRGAVVVTGSIVARVPAPNIAAYAAAKHALRGWLGSLRIELRSEAAGVDVAMVHPGIVDTPLWRTLSSATGELPRTPPEGYSPDEVARALVAQAIDPRPELTVGGEARTIELLFAGARPVAEAALVLFERFTRSGRDPAPEPGGLRESLSRGHETGEVTVTRPSLVGMARRILP